MEWADWAWQRCQTRYWQVVGSRCTDEIPWMSILLHLLLIVPASAKFQPCCLISPKPPLESAVHERGEKKISGHSCKFLSAIGNCKYDPIFKSDNYKHQGIASVLITFVTKKLAFL